MDSRALIDQIPSLRRYARALTGDAWAADDLVQDTLERACHKWQLWIVGSDLRAWLFTIMHNVFASQTRRAPPPRAMVDIDEVAAQLPGAEGARDRAIDLQRCLLLLPEEQRAALLLVALEDMSYAQLSRVLNVPLGTVMSRLARARVRLQDLMEGAPPPAAGRPGLRRLK
ncbi:RNA polymerase subunit sigma-24 [Variovorax sp. WS11]|uniref:sigma-70 family RNA polymerase sigma factor n=1 Tax=Variovorax sp. WS11 TaxID=1105204 RepID=UPI000D0C98F5|nr:sigma-70 family RNA polymerase sigma factor [Variovorax sp. WS11]NDZ16239.1 sigma-70 family RNA polymerase sigma factor [Variovorax sp. WS11]PSL83882.1 RNA polymerase subunit sigma-24 [Variovorax sp. WS11]